MHVAILGGGLAGMAAAQRLVQHPASGGEISIYEKNAYLGGHIATHRRDGFGFDEGPHVSFTKNETIRQVLAKGVQGKYLEHQAKVGNIWRGHWVSHPAQCHLFGLPQSTVKACVDDFIAAAKSPESTAASEDYAQWCKRHLGRAFSEQFTFLYTEKYWTVSASQMTADWVGQRMHRPSIEEVIRGARELVPATSHYVTHFRYPCTGGFSSYAAAVHPEGARIELNAAIAKVDLTNRMLTLADGRQEGFDRLISSLPLPRLISMISPQPPAPVLRAAEALCCTSVLLVNIGVDRAEGFPDYHWFYSYDRDIPFARINYPHHLSPDNAPKGCGSIQVEIYHSKYRALPEVQDWPGCVVEHLRRMGVLQPRDQILSAWTQHVPYGNVLFDHDRKPALEIIQAYLREHGLLTCGRYGDWGYYWTDDSILSGWRTAETCLST